MIYALPPLAAESVFNIGTFSVTNTYINSTLTVILFIILAYFVQRSIRSSKHNVPRGIQNFFEFVIETLLGYFDQVTGDRKKSLNFLPLIGTLFFFILVSNWLGILPGVGTFGIRKGAEFIPLFRSANTDLNLTLAMAIFGVIFAHVIGIFSIGFFKYLNKYIKVSDIWHAVKSKKLIIIFTAFIEFMVGFLEIISEVAKMVSLSLRLFGNVFAGEVLLTILAGIISYVVPLPFIALELLVGLIQATVFSMLVLTYITVATMPVHKTSH
ncbi:MAG: F0F1 ATP synthase subunit A [Candidatus Doudnabacteria bacterium]